MDNHAGAAASAAAAGQGATQLLARYAAELRYEDLPPDVLARAKACFLDSLGCCLLGMTQPWTRMIIDQVMEEGGNPRAGLLGSDIRTSINQAVMVGATAGHGFELDDIHGAAHLHAGSLAIPTILALAESRPDCTGRDLLAAMVAGYEAGLRVGLAATGALFMRGHHFQATCGVFVAAAAAANMLRLTPEQARQAFGIAGSLAAGLMAAQEGAMVKRLHAGHAAQMGVNAAMLAARGFTGIPNVLEAEYGGFLSTLSGAPELDWLTRGLGTQWEILNVGFKPYATAASIHSPLRALDDIMRDNRLRAADIEHIQVHCSEMAHRHCAWPYTPAGVTAAQMNMLFALAMMAVDRAAMGAQFRAERLEDPAVLAMLARIDVQPDERYSKGGDSTRHAARIRVQTTSGAVYENETWDRPGSPNNPMTAQQLREKFQALAGALLPDAAVRTLEDVIAHLEQRRYADLAPLLFAR
jgi:2-methylcitrate dehydratase PrpD